MRYGRGVGRKGREGDEVWEGSRKEGEGGR